MTANPSLLSLEGKTALVTGASSGLGAHFARLLASAGAEVVLTARRAAALEAVAAEIVAQGGRCTVASVDVSDSASIERLGALRQVDILINNAGVVREATVFDIAEDDWDTVLDTNLKGMFLMAQSVGRAMRQRGAGAIVNIASILGLRQSAAVLPYAVSKAGVMQLTKTLALELARFNIRVNALAPGYVETDLNSHFWQTSAGEALVRRIPQRRLGRLSDLDGPLLLLASDASAYMNGAIVAVDGGHLVSGL